MCRIAGIFDHSLSDLAKEIVTMRDSMKHGGPDAEGIYIDDQLPLALGHRRLSFLDLSPAGNQPMADCAGQLQLVFNGEIYNFIGLKKELETFGHCFKTGSDSEVILKAYLQWGTACFNRFNGMFALAIFDKRSSQLVLARDHAGIKPLYYSITKNSFHFASEVKAFTSIYPSWPENDNWKIHLLTFGHLPEPVTTLQNVVPLAKGTVLIIDLHTLQARKEIFSTFAFSSSVNTLPLAIELVKEKLTRAVERHLISDAPIGLFLSGGLDSSLLTLLAHKTLQDNLHTISINFEDEEFSETRFQKIIIETTGARHSSIVVKEEEFANSLPDIIKAMDQPSIDGINSYFISKYARKNELKAVLSGVGADELFGGYDSFNNRQKIRRILKAPAFLFAMAAAFPDHRRKRLSFLQRNNVLSNYLLNRGLYIPGQTAEILGCSVKHVYDELSRIAVPAVEKFPDDRDMISWAEQNLYMQNQLLKDTDYMSMWHGLEVRVPFLDKELMEAVHSIAPEIKYDSSLKKHLLVKAFQNIIPKEIYTRKKQGFIFPFSNWIKNVQIKTGRNEAYAEKFNRFKSGKIPWAHYWAFLLALYKDEIRYNEKAPVKLLFLNLMAFSKTGGIEKFNRAFLKALSNLETEGRLYADGWSCYDNEPDVKYFKQENYKGFKGARIRYVYKALQAAAKYDTIVLGHINLATIGWFAKLMWPSKKVVLIAHGIEVWYKLHGLQDAFIRKADQILAVSNYTKHTMERVHSISSKKITVFHNTIDPYFTFPTSFTKPEYLLARYSLTPQQPVIFTLTRLAFSEKYKGYDKVMKAMPQLDTSFPAIKYILSGKCDQQEQNRLEQLKEANNLNGNMILTGFIPEEEVADHFLLADSFIMPSSKEGFGIVFIEAMACGLPVIGGNRDGTVDALKQGEMGMLINPESETEIVNALMKTLSHRENSKSTHQDKLALQGRVIKEFGFEVFTNNLRRVMCGEDEGGHG